MNVPAGSVTASAATSSAEANARFGERLAREIEGVLGVGIAADAIDVEGDGNQSATIGAMPYGRRTSRCGVARRRSNGHGSGGTASAAPRATT